MNEPHLDDELLSASLDGEADRDAEAHLTACTSCRTRLDALDVARRAVATAPPGPRTEVVERSLAAAREAWTADRSPATVVPLRQQEHASRRRPPSWALGVAAAVAALVVAVPLVTRDRGASQNDQTASAPARDSAADLQSAAEDEAVDGGDLGEQSDQLLLGGVLGRAVTRTGGPAAPFASEAEGGAETTAGKDAAPADAATTTTALTGQSTSRAALPPAGARTTTTGARPCADVVRSTFGSGLDALVYTALLRWQGTPAVVLAYRLDDTVGPGPDHRAFVMARDDCRLLVVQGF